MIDLPRDHVAIVRRVLNEMIEKAEHGLATVSDLEDQRIRAGNAVSSEKRSSGMSQLASLLPKSPVMTPTALSRAMEIGLSGAGKLLARAELAGLVTEVTGRKAWRTYLTPDLSISLGYQRAKRGRPASRPTLAANSDLEAILAKFDAEMATYDIRFGSTIDSGSESFDAD